MINGEVWIDKWEDESINVMIMRKFCCLIAVVVLLFSCNREKQLTDYVNPFVGTDGHGHTYPGAIVPFGMIQPGPDTRLEGWDGCSGYHYTDDTVYGFSQTHLSGTGCEDLCDLLLMPIDESFVYDGESLKSTDYCSHFTHKKETARPGYYSVHLDRNGVDVELTCDKRRAAHRYRYAKENHNGFVIDLQHRDKLLSGGISWQQSEECGNDIIVGHRHSASWNPDQHLYFAIESDQKIESVEIVNDSTQAVVRFAEGVKVATLRVAISGVDEAGAVKNLNSDEKKSFDEMKSAANDIWESELSKIKVEGGTKEQKRCFYTALYHCMTSPYLWSDADGRYRGQDGEIHEVDGEHEMYTVFSLWDTYRALHPLLTIIDRQRTENFIYSILKHYEQGGETTMWELAAHETHCMIGYHAAPVVLEAATAGILDEWPDSLKFKLLEGLMVTSNLEKYGRSAYAQQGYLSSEEDNESVSKTLEYAYDDWCIAQFAAMIGSVEQDATFLNHIYDTYMKRSQSWRNLMDEDGYMHPMRNGGFMTPFNPTEINNNYTEGNSWQYSTYVPHDVYGWIELQGGEDAAGRFLDSLFFGSSQLSGRDQVDVTGLVGQYAHGNEPSHHAAYLYTYVGHPERTQKLVSHIVHTLYSSRPDGLCGNEDCGQMSAWYVMSTMGFYPVCPGSGEYVTVKPLFNKVTITVPDREQIVIDSKTWQNGKFWRQGEFYDHSVSATAQHEIITPTPWFSDWRQRFDTCRMVDISVRSDAYIYYTTDGSQPDTSSSLFTEPFPVRDDVTVKAVAYSPETGYSNVVTQYLTRFVADKRLTYVTEPDPQYYENGAEGLVDHLYGQENYRIGGWQGWQKDMEVVIDLLEPREIHSVGASCLEDTRSWVFFPSAIEASVSDDGKEYRPFASQPTGYEPVADPAGTKALRTFEVKGKAIARYIRLKVKNYGPMPAWHLSPGEQAWLFVDEVEVK